MQKKSPNFKQTHDSATESKLFQHYHHSGICTNIQLWWQWSWWVLQGTPVSSWSNTKAGHSGCTRWLEYESWRRCTWRLGRSLWTFLQSGDQWQRAQNLQQPCVLANTLGNHKPFRRWTWHSRDGTHHKQIDNILVKKRFRSGIKTARTRTFPVQMLEATMTWWWWLPRHALRIQGNKPSQESGLISRSWMIQQWWVLSRQL